MRKTILITNDDGFESNGLRALKEALEPLANIIVVAPTLEKSACGHSLTLTRPLRFIELEENFYKLDDGTPSDCVFLSLTKLFKEKKPDLVVSGINKGVNLGEDITYSGTAAAAMEAVLQGIPAVAISQAYNEYKDLDNFDYALAKKTIANIVEKIFKEDYPLEDRRFLNINIPFAKEAEGIKITHAGRREYGCDAQVHINPRGQEYYWIGLPKMEWKKHPNPLHDYSDIEAINDGFISISPIHLDLTHYDSIKRLEAWI